MKKFARLKAGIVLVFLIYVCLAQEDNNNEGSSQEEASGGNDAYVELQLDSPYQDKLDSGSAFVRKYSISIDESSVQELAEDKWYLFVEVEPLEEYSWENTKIQLFLTETQGNQVPVKECDSENGVDSCFLTNANFDYTSTKVHVKVTCSEECEYRISAELSIKYALRPNEQLQLDFQNTAYSKLFSLDTDNEDNFKRLEIILAPTSFLSFNAPIKLYANKDNGIPTKEKHDYEGVHLWDDGLGIFIDYPDASNKFTILVEGPEQNILKLQTKLIYDETITETTPFTPYFSYIESQQKQTFKIPIQKAEKTYIKITTLTGSVELSAVKDENKSEIDTVFTPLPRSYGELEYKFEPQFFERNSDKELNDFMYVEVKGRKESTYVFQSYSNNNEINYLLPQVNRNSELLNQHTDQFYIKLIEVEGSMNGEGKSRIELTSTTYQDTQDKLETHIFLCTESSHEGCILSQDDLSKLNSGQTLENTERRRELTQSSDSDNFEVFDNYDGVRYYDIRTQYSEYAQSDGIYTAYIIIVLTNTQEDSDQNDPEILYTLQYRNTGNTYFLKEKELRKDRLSIDETKYYYFSNNDADVKSLKLHVTEISGQVMMQGYLEDPREIDLEGQEIYEYHNSLTFENVQQGQELWVKVQGIDSAYYSLYLQLIRNSEVVPDDGSESKETDGYNQLIIKEGEQYEFLVKPQEKIIFQIHATTEQFQLFLGSHLPLGLCMTENLDEPPFRPNCEVTESLTRNERMEIKMDKGLIANVGVTNTNDKTVEFKIQVSPLGNKCTIAPTAYLNSFQLEKLQKEGEETFFTCHQYLISKRAEVEVIVDLENKDYEASTINLELNGKENTLMLNARHKFRVEEIEKVCGSGESISCTLKIEISSPVSTSASIIVQYSNDDLVLVDGISHTVYMDATSERPRHFMYSLTNLANTTILLQSQVGYFNFYGGISSMKQIFEVGPDRSQLFPTKESNVFSSHNPFYTNYHQYQLSEQQISESGCSEECVLMLSVYPEANNYQIDGEGKFRIQCTQEDTYLKENAPSVGYLEKGSLAFYEYKHNVDGSIFVRLNNQNKNCAKMFIKSAYDGLRPTPSDFEASSTGNNLTLENAPQGKYSISVEAVHKYCEYSIQVMSSSVQFSNLHVGTLNDQILNVNETRHLLYTHSSSESFKVMALNKVGELLIKVKPASDEEINSYIEAGEAFSEIEAALVYSATNIDFVKIGKQELFFCSNCTYLISILASQYTETSIIIPSNGLEIPISKDTLAKDILAENETTEYRIFTNTISQFQLHVQYGKVNVTVIETITNTTIISKVYEETKDPVYEKLVNPEVGPEWPADDFNGPTRGNSLFGMSYYSKVIVSNVGSQSSFYSFELLESDEEQESGSNVRFGIPEYFYLQAQERKCFKGFLSNADQQFIISFSEMELESVKQLEFSCTVDGKPTSVSKNYGVSEMVLSMSGLKLEKSSPYEVCLKSNEPVSLTFIQSSHIILIPPNTKVFLAESANLTFGASGQTVVELDDCEGRAVISVSSYFNDLHNIDRDVPMVRRSNNLLEFYQYGPTYIHIETNGSRIRWRPKSEYDNVGMGYDKFAPGKANAYKQNGQLKIDFDPIVQLSQYDANASARIDNIKYRIVLASDEKTLKSTLHCQATDMNALQNRLESKDLSSSLSTVFEISDETRNMFSSRPYFLAGIIATMSIEVNHTMQSYRFIYPNVDVQREVLQEGSIFDPPEQNEGFGSLFLSFMLKAIIVLIVLFILYILYVKVVKKWLRNRRLQGRGSGLSSQGSANFKYTEFASMND